MAPPIGRQLAGGVVLLAVMLVATVSAEEGAGSPPLYDVAVVRDVGLSGWPESPLYAPSDEDAACLAATRQDQGQDESLTAWFPRHDLCASLPETTVDAVLTDDIVIRVEMNEAGWISGVRITGQDAYGADGVYHESDPVEPEAVETYPDGSFVVHVHADHVALRSCDTEGQGGETPCDRVVATFALDDLIYTAEP